uniref:Low-density lipoprotein receptor-related protein 1B n=1 Tax=Cacopsylla melanoneura TaxID=428564 RepID=A0A8D8V4R9_9HEMI
MKVPIAKMFKIDTLTLLFLFFISIDLVMSATIMTAPSLESLEPDNTGDKTCDNPRQFWCPENCIDLIKVCDGIADCDGGLDETVCSQDTTCRLDEFKCKTGNCIPIHLRCDSYVDCADESDQENCPKCPSDDFRCPNGKCITKKWTCNGVPDCFDASDEKNCTQCQEGVTRCPTGACITSEQTCDDVNKQTQSPPTTTTKSGVYPLKPALIVTVLIGTIMSLYI